MHQPYYKNLLTHQINLPWVRLHGAKDYLDMVEILKDYSNIRLTFNLVPSLIEQIQDYEKGAVNDKFFELSLKPADKLTPEDKKFILDNFFSINKEKVISFYPRYYELYLKKSKELEFTLQDYLDLQVWFNLAWIDPYFRQQDPQLREIVKKGRFFSEGEKRICLNKQLEILGRIIPTYRKFLQTGQIEISVSPFYHPILPLLYNTNIAKEANPRTILPQTKFSFPEDAEAQIKKAVDFFKEQFLFSPKGMWPSEQAVSEHILPIIIKSGINWIVADEGILFRSLKKKKRDSELVYQPYLLKRDEGVLNIVFRDRNLSDLIGFVYNHMDAESAVGDFMRHLENIHNAFKNKDVLVVIAMDGENAWEYYRNDGWDFLSLLYNRLSESEFIKTTTVSNYLKNFTPTYNIPRLSAGSWIYAEFSKWINSPSKNLLWEKLFLARQELEKIKKDNNLSPERLELAFKQIYILEGSDWFWWAGDEEIKIFEMMFQEHLDNFYAIIGNSS